MQTMLMTQEEIMLGNAAFTSNLNVIHHAYVDITGDLIAGALLGQILYWFGADRNGKPRARIQRDGHLWIAKARGDWWQEIRITPKQYDRAAKILVKAGYIELRTMKFRGNPTTHIRILSANLNKAIDNWKREQARAHMEREHEKLVAVGFSPLGNNDLYQPETTVFPNGQHRDYPNVNFDVAETVTSFTENKAENKKESIADSTRTLAGDCELLSFDEIWGHYPKKTGRSKAQRAYDLAISKGANAFAILAETVLFSQYTQSMLDRDEIEWRYIPSGGVWYEEERWRDETLLIGRHLGFDKGMEHNRQAAELRRLATAALEREMQPEILERMRAIILDMPY